MKTVLNTPDVACGIFENVFCIYWRVLTTVQGVAAVREQVQAVQRQQTQSLALITVIHEKAAPPASDAREALVKMLNDAQGVKASAVFFEGTGLRAAVVRSVVAGLTLLARQPFPHKVFGSMGDATAFLEKTMTGLGLRMPPAPTVINVVASWRAGLR